MSWADARGRESGPPQHYGSGSRGEPDGATAGQFDGEADLGGASAPEICASSASTAAFAFAGMSWRTGVFLAPPSIATLTPVALFLAFQRLFLSGAGLGGAVKG
ncbi:hypothetical protein BW733_03010 [Tessaracoccus flavescens]|uniref:Uncharacterized protein n=1 Tax=Tessaracoccus flavescens TaxID=399497 RepID=A0A1Q2CV48_9ACTN|nr:hypothetical protein BW733_03010 [Tessaracoccus flavescens]